MEAKLKPDPLLRESIKIAEADVYLLPILQSHATATRDLNIFGYELLLARKTAFDRAGLKEASRRTPERAPGTVLTKFLVHIAPQVPTGVVSINIAAEECNFTDRHDELCRSCASSPLVESLLEQRRLQFEITENTMLREGGVQLIYRLKSLGYRFALDDIGQGVYEDHYYVNHLINRLLPIDQVKISGKLIHTHPELLEGFLDRLSLPDGVSIVFEGVPINPQLHELYPAPELAPHEQLYDSQIPHWQKFLDLVHTKYGWPVYAQLNWANRQLLQVTGDLRHTARAALL